MANVFRRTYVDPKSSKKKKTAKYYGKYVDGDGVQRRVPLSNNRSAAQMMLNDLVRTAEREKAGVFDPFREHRRRPLAVHLADWEGALRARGNVPRYVGMKVAYVKRIVEACGFVFIADLSASKVEAAIAVLKEQPRFGIQTANHYLAATKQFIRWLVADRRTLDSPLAHLEGGNVKLDRRHERRELADGELARLFETARTAGPFRGLAGLDREILYVVAVYTGLRASELASLTPASFTLSDRPTVTVAAAYSKHRREDVLPLHSDAVRLLRPWLEQRPAAAPLWPGKWASGCQAGSMLKRDLAAARVSWVAEADPDSRERSNRESSDFLKATDAAGRVVDFHCLRHTFITRLVKAGVKPKDAQTLARHSTITLTMDRYAHVGIRDVATALDLLPSIPGPERDSGPVPLRMTGTDGTIPTGPNLAPAGPKLALFGDSSRLRLRTDDETSVPPVGAGGRLKSPQKTTIEVNRRDMMSGEGGIRTLVTREGKSVFETDAFNHSATSPATLKIVGPTRVEKAGRPRCFNFSRPSAGLTHG